MSSLVAFGFFPALSQAAELLPMPPPDDTARQVVVLHNGSTLVGSVSEDGGNYLISKQGARLRIEASEVAFVADSFQEAYEQRLKNLTRPTAPRHLDLAQWCLRHGLIAQAEQEVASARRLDSAEPNIELVERRITMAKNNSRRAAVVAAKAVTPPVPKLHHDESTDQKFDLELLPDGALELFTRRIQPLLVNNCTTAACHSGPNESGFQLSRAILYGESNRRTTTQNLLATLKQLNFESPEDSPLITIPLQSHGGLEHSVFPPHRRGLHDQIQEWVRLVSGKPERSAETDSHLSVYQQRTEGVVPASFVPPQRFGRRPPRIRFGIQPRSPINRQPVNADEISRQIAAMAEQSARKSAGEATSSEAELDSEREPDLERESDAESESDSERD